MDGDLQLEEKSADCKDELQLENPGETKVPGRLWTVVYSVLTVCMLSLLIGATLTFSSPVLVELMHLEDPQFRFGTLLSDIFGAASQVGAIFGGPLGGWIADRYGRKTSVVFNSLPYLFGYFIILCSASATNGVVFKVMLMVGRVLSGVGMGWAYVLVGVYIGEISPARYRGAFATFGELSLTAGIVLLLALGSIPGVHYFHLALIAVGIMAVFVCLVMWIPETPRWLLSHSQDRRVVVSVMRCLRGPHYSKLEQEIQDIKAAIPKKSPTFCEKLKQLMCERSSLVPFLLLLFIYTYQLATGTTALNSYIGTIFSDLGVPFPNVTATFSFGAVKILVVLASVVLIEVVGRKVLLAVSSGGMLFASLLLGTHFYITRPSLCNNATVLELGSESELIMDCNPDLYPVAITAVTIFSISFSFGLGPVPWVLLSEYLPLKVRGVAGGIAGTAGWISATVVTGSFLNFSEALGAWSAWWTFAGINFVGFLVIVLFVLETKGKKLEEVQDLFAKRTHCCSCCSMTKTADPAS